MKFGLNNEGKEYTDGNGYVSYTIDGPCVAELEFKSFEIKPNSKGNHFMTVIATAIEPTEGLNNPDTGNRQYVSNQFYLTEKVMSMDNTANPQEWFGYISEKLGFKEEYAEKLKSVGTIEEFGDFIQLMFEGKQFAGIVMKKLYTKANGKPGNTAMLPVFGTIARSIDNKAELQAELDKAVNKAIAANPDLAAIEDKNLQRELAFLKTAYVVDERAPVAPAGVVASPVVDDSDEEF